MPLDSPAPALVLVAAPAGPVPPAVAALAAAPGLRLLPQAVTASAAAAATADLRPALVVVSTRLPEAGAVRLVRHLTGGGAVPPPGRAPAVVVLGAAVVDDHDVVAAALRCGARGYLREDAVAAEASAVAALCLGTGGPGVPAARRARAATPPEDPPALSQRELEVLDGMARGRSNADIGRELFIAEDTVKTHARQLFRKLRAPDRAAAVATGLRCGLVR